MKRGDDRVWEPTGYTVVDDGRTDEVRALRYYSASVDEGEVVRVTLTPDCGTSYASSPPAEGDASLYTRS